MPPWPGHSSSAGWQESRAPAAGSEAAVRRRPGWGDETGAWAGLETPGWKHLPGSGCGDAGWSGAVGAVRAATQQGKEWARHREREEKAAGVGMAMTTVLFATLTRFHDFICSLCAGIGP